MNSSGTQESLIKAIVDDLVLCGGTTWFRRIMVFLGRPQFRVLFWYRIAHHSWEKEWPLCYQYANLRMSRFGTHIHPNAALGRRVKLPHPVGIVIGQGVVVEDDCTIYQHVTLGTDGKDARYPVLSKGATVYAGAVVIGGCTIGEHAVVGAGSLVLQDVPANSVAKGNPARVQ